MENFFFNVWLTSIGNSVAQSLCPPQAPPAFQAPYLTVSTWGALTIADGPTA